MDASGAFNHLEWLQNPHLRREASEVLAAEATTRGRTGPLPEAVDARLRQVLRELRDTGEVGPGHCVADAVGSSIH